MIPLAIAKKDLSSTMLAQTFAFVTFNKVCTSQVSPFIEQCGNESLTILSQYFLWYMMFLPYYLPESTLLASRSTGITALALWVLGQVRRKRFSVLFQANCMQVFWLQQGFQLEFNGRSTFVPGLWASSILFFLVNVGILGIIIRDVREKAPSTGEIKSPKKKV